VLGGAPVSKGGVTSPAVVEALDVLEEGSLGLGSGWTSSVLSVPKKLSTGALSQQLPRRLMLQQMPCMQSELPLVVPAGRTGSHGRSGAADPRMGYKR
jgi:hypothetical protein